MNTEQTEKNVEKTEKKRFSLNTPDKALLAVVALLILIIVVLGILQRLGLSLVNGTMMLQLPVLTVVVLISWGGYALVRRIKNRTAKIVVGSVAVLVLVLAMTLISSYISFIAALTVPQRYATLQSPSGAHRVVVLRSLDGTDERLEARRTARLAADPDGDPEFVLQDYGYVYKAWPKAWGPFYRSNADVQGEVFMAYEAPAAPAAEGEGGEAAEPAAQPAHGTLMVDWQDDESAVRFYVKDPGVAEGGECTLTF